MTPVIRASPSPTSPRIPPIKHDDLQGLGEGALTSPLQNLVPFNGLPGSPSLWSLPLLVGCLSGLPLHPLLFQGTVKVKVATCHWPDTMARGSSRRRKWLQAPGAGLADVGSPRLHPAFIGERSLLQRIIQPLVENRNVAESWPRCGGWESVRRSGAGMIYGP